LLGPELAADGRRVVIGRTAEGNIDVWIVDLGRGVPARLTFDAGIDNAPLWSPDASQVVFRSSRNGFFDLFRKPANGTTDEQPLLVTPQNKSPLDWSRDGRFLLYSVQSPDTASDLWVLPLAGDGKPAKPFAVLQSRFDEIEGQFSPDGRWLAYASNESGRYEIYVRTFPEATGRWPISVAGGVQPRWRADGRELYYVAPDTRLMAVGIRAAPNTHTIEVAPPVALFSPRLAIGGNIPAAGFQARAQYAIASDGRFLMNIAADDAIGSPIRVVLNWSEELKQRVPTK
jgi:Tol biopolymer transport system component